MVSAGAPGRASWVLAWGLLAGALVLPAGAGGRARRREGRNPLGRAGAALPPGDGTGAPGAGPARPAQVLPGMTWPCAETSHFGATVETPFGRKITGKLAASGPHPTSAARGLWAQSTLAFAPSWPKKTLFKRESPLTLRPYGETSKETRGAPENGVIFQKCAVVSGPKDLQTAQVRLLVNNTRTPAAANLSDLLLLDNITGLSVQGSPGNRTAEGLQAFSRQFLQVGDAFLISYTASLDARDLGGGTVLTLPARLSFQTSSMNRMQLEAHFTLTVEEKIQVLPNHGLHAAGFFSAFLISLVLTCLALFSMLRCRCWMGTMLSRHQVQHHENKLEHSQFTSANGVSEDLALNDQMMDILCSEDLEGMLQALEELEIATLNRADSDLEACRTQISKDIIALLLRNLTSRRQLSPQVERRMGALFKKQFLLLEREIQEEYDRKMVALTAECDLEVRKKTEHQQRREMAAAEEAEEVLKHVSERSAAQCSSLLRTLHGLEQEQLGRSLTLQREEDVAKARRQLAVFQRTELHSLFFTQIKSAACKGDLQPEAAKALLQDYAKIQEDVEELMDFFQASKRYHLSKRFGHREYLVQNLQSSDTRVQGLLNAAAAQLSLLIQKHERAGYLDEDQMEVLLERAQTEVFSVKQKLDNDLKQEKRKLCQKLITKRRRELLQKHKEQRKEQLALGEAFRAAEDTGEYLGQWRELLAKHGAALEELQERLDQAALDELRALTLSLSEKASEELRRLQNSVLTQELLKRSVPWLFLQQILEEHGKEMATCAQQLEAEERDRGQEGVRGVRQRLKDNALEASVEEQAELRHWERLVFAKLCSSPLSLSEEESLRAQQEVHGCFSQMDRSLALPKIRAQVLLQQFLAAWREAECLQLDKSLAAPELQPPPKARKSRSKSKSKIDLLKKSIEDKIQLFEEQAPEDLVEKVRGELRGERVQQLEAQEARFVESLVSLQFQKAARMTRTLRAYTALLSTQDLLLEELSASETLTTVACAQILESHNPELQELERKLEDKLAHQEAAWLQRVLSSGQQWEGEGPWLLNEPDTVDSERQVSAALQRALTLGQKCLKQHQQGWGEEQQGGAALEDLLEKMENDTFVTLYSQELRLASYLSRLTMVPAATLRRLLSVALPTASQPELLALPDSISQKHPDHVVESDPGEQADLGRSRKHQDWWRDLESKLRGDLRSRGAEKMLWARRRKESILKKTCLPLGERVVLPGKGSWPHLTLESVGELAPVPIVGAEAIDLLHTGEKLFIFRTPAEPKISLHLPPRKKKKSFLNAKKAVWAPAID